MHANSKHTFSFFTQTVLHNHLAFIPGGSFTLADEDLWRRMFTVLRLEKDDECIIFDGTTAVQIALTEEKSKKNIIRGSVIKAYAPSPITPPIHLYQGLLRRDAFDAVVYTAAQMGITTVTPILSKKIQRQWGDDRELTRIDKVIIAACEQAKQFISPVVNEPKEFVELTNLITQVQGYWICLDPSGQSFVDLVQAVTQQPTGPFHVIIGPEGGFTAEEEKLLKDAGVNMFALTPTILRSIDAAVLVLGTLRSIISTGA